jgi:hypothetical protein
MLNYSLLAYKIMLNFYLIQVNKSANQYMHYMMCPILNN